MLRHIFSKPIIFIILAVIAPGLTIAQNFSRYATSVEGIDADKIAIYIEDLRNGEVVLDVNGEEPMIPASVTKLFTAATAFRKVNLDTVYQTDVILQGKISDGVLNGNIIIKANGDPTIESRYFPKYNGVADSIACSIKRYGITSIKGRIIIDEPAWLKGPMPKGWMDEDLNWPYGAGHYPLNYADNRFSLSYSGKDNYRISPATPDIKIKPSSKGEQIWRNKDSATYNVNYKGKKTLNLDLANPLPSSSFIQAIKNSLQECEITVDGSAIKPKNKSVVVYTYNSPPIYQILKSLVMRSNNQMAEAMLRYTWPGLSRDEAAKQELDLWNKLGVNVDDIFLEDGSGLSRNNRLTAYSLADMLVWMVDNDSNLMRFANLLPRAGNSGTLKHFLKDTPLENRIWAKTGSMNKIQTYAGYAVDTHGVPTHVVVIMVNGFKEKRSELKKKLESILIEKIR